LDAGVGVFTRTYILCVLHRGILNNGR